MKHNLKALEEYIDSKIPEGYVVRDFEETAHQKTLTLDSTRTSAVCPDCGHVSEKVKERRYRNVQHMPENGKTVLWRLQVKEFKCLNPDCARKSFTPSEGFVESHQRVTKELRDTIAASIPRKGFSGAFRSLEATGVRTSASSVRRVFSRIGFEKPNEVPFLGIDDVSIKKGLAYATVVYDGKTHAPLSLARGRTEEGAMEALEPFPEAKTIARDGSKAFKSAADKRCPGARQVYDRFHMTKNLNEEIKAFLAKHLPKRFFFRFGRLISPEEYAEVSGRTKINLRTMGDDELRGLVRDLQNASRGSPGRSKKRLNVLSEIFGLTNQNIKSLLDYTTGGFENPDRDAPADLTKYRNVKTVSRDDLWRYIASGGEGRLKRYKPLFEQIMARHEEARFAWQARMDYLKVMRGDDPEKLEEFLEKYEKTAVSSFVHGLRQDIDAAKNAIALKDVSSGFVEGKNNLLKLVERSGFGRLKLPALENRFKLEHWMTNSLSEIDYQPYCSKT